MFDMGFLELLLIGIIALIVLGPERLPKAARAVGLWIGKAKQGFESIKTEIDRELKLKELQDQIAEQKAELTSELNVKSDFESLKDELTNSANTIRNEASAVSAALNPAKPEAKSEPSSESPDDKASPVTDRPAEKENKQ